MDIDLYRVKIRFSRLFPDPAIFDEPSTIAQRYLSSTGLSHDKARFIHQSTDETRPVDDTGKPSVVSGEASFRLEGKTVRSEYMAGANVTLDYVDFGSGMSLANHKELWNRGRWGELNFELVQMHHERRQVDLPDVTDLYRMLSAGREPATLATVELNQIPDSLVGATISFINLHLDELAKLNGESVEVYAAKQLTAQEKAGLAKRLTREIGPSSVLVILSRHVGDGESRAVL